MSDATDIRTTIVQTRLEIALAELADKLDAVAARVAKLEGKVYAPLTMDDYERKAKATPAPMTAARLFEIVSHTREAWPKGFTYSDMFYDMYDGHRSVSVPRATLAFEASGVAYLLDSGKEVRSYCSSNKHAVRIGGTIFLEPTRVEAIWAAVKAAKEANP